MDNTEPPCGDDDLIDRNEVSRLLGGISTSTVYADPEIRELAIPLTPPGKRVKLVRWVRGDIIRLRNQRITRAREGAEAVRLNVLARNLRRAEKRRQQRLAPQSNETNPT